MPIIKGFADFEPLTPEPKSGVIKGFADFEPVYRSNVAPPESGDFMTGVKQSGLELAGTAYGLAGLAGAGVGSEGLKQWGLENAQRKFEESGAMGKEVYSLEGINSVGDAIDYLQRGVGYVGAQAIPAILTGGVGSSVAKKFVEQGVKELAKKTVAGSAAEQAAILAAKQQVGKASTRGAIGSMGITGYGQAAGSLYPEMVSEGYDEPGRAALYAAPIAALDVIPAARAARQILMPGAKKGILKEIRNQAAGESLTELGQTGLERQAAYKDLTSPEARSEYLNAMALGALGGGMLGGVSAALNNRAVESNILGTANPTADEQKPLLGIGYNPAAGTPTVFPDGSQALGSEEVAPVTQAATAVASAVDQEILDAASGLGLNLNNTKGKPLPRKVELFTKAFDLYKAGAIDDAVYTQTVERLKKRGKHNDVEVLLAEADAAFVEKQRKANQPKFQRAPRPEGPNVSTDVSTAGGPATSVGTGGVDVSGGVASTGSAPAVGPGGDVGARVAGISPAGNETSLLGNVSSQPATTLTLPKPKELSEEDRIAIEKDVGDAGLATAAEEQAQRDEFGMGEEVSMTSDEEAQAIERILEARFANSKDKERDIKIARAYIKAQKNPTQGFSAKVQNAIGAPYGIKDEAVRDIGNVKALVDTAVSLGMTEAEARMLLTGELAPEVIGTKSSEGKPADGLQGAIAEAGVESEEGATGGFGYDDSRTWVQGVKGAGDMINATDEKFANRVYVLSEQVESLEATMRDIPETAEQLRPDLIATKEKLDKALADYNEYLADKSKPKKAKAGSKKAALAEPTDEKTAAGVSGRDVWNQLREDIVGLGEYKDLTKSEKGYLDELAARTNGDFTITSEPSLETVIDNNMDYDRVADQSADEMFNEDFEADDGTSRYSRSATEESWKDNDGNKFTTQPSNIAKLRNYPGFARGMRGLQAKGMMPVVQSIDRWLVTTDNVPWDGMFAYVDGKSTIVFSEATLNDDVLATHTFTHEVGHAADAVTATGGGDYSSEPALNLTVKNGKVNPVGVVAREVYNHFINDPKSPLSFIMTYPIVDNKGLTSDMVREEMFAQLFAFNISVPGAQFLKDNLPQTAAFMERANAEIKKTFGATYLTAATQNASGKSGQVQVESDGARLFDGKKLQSNKEKILNSVAAETVTNTAKKLLNAVVFSSDLFRIATKAGLKSAQKMATIYRQRSNFEGSIEKEVERIASLYTRIPQNERGMGAGSANALMRDMTREGKWGFKPLWRTGDTANVKIDGALERRWKQMSEPSKVWIEETFKHGDAMLKLKKQTLMDAANSEYDILIKEAQAKGDTKKIAKLQADKRNQLKQFDRLFSVDTMRPYAPLSRYGNYVVVANSAAYEKATPEQKAKMEDDPDHHTVTFAESMSSALTLKRQLQEQGGFQKIEAFEKEKAQEGMYGGLMKAFNQLRSNLDSELANITDPEDRNALAKARAVVADLYLASLAENSARKAELRRKGVAGEIDMLRSFATRGRADAQFLATVKYTPQMTEVINKLRQETKESGRSLEKSQAFNEIMARHNQTLAYDDSAWNEFVAKTTRLTSVWMLATSPMYYIQNLTQPIMLSVPFMTQKHNYFKAQNALIKAYSQLGSLITNSKLDEQFDFKNVPADVREMISTLVDRQQIDIGMETELGRFQLAGESKTAQGVNKADRILRSLSQKMEIINRVSTAMAAYRLELAKTGDVKQATEYASEVIEQTHGDYTRINAPRAFNTNIGKVALQFRKFQLIQGTLLLKLIKNSLAGATKEERTAAFTALKFTLGHALAMTGLVGVPGWAALSFIINGLVGIFDEGEEPYNLENDIYQSLVGQFGEDAATMIMRGTPTLAGVDVSQKIGMGNVLSILPFTDFELSKAGVSDVGFALAFGASGSLAQRFADGLKLIGSGEYYRGMEKLAPKGFADAAKALRENDEGVTRLNGDVLVPADEIEGIKSFAKGLGVPVVSETKRRFLTDVKFDTEKAFKDKAAKLKNQFVKARKEGEDTSAIREKWSKLQEERVSEGFKREPLSSLLQAPQAQAQRERQTVGGIQFNKQTRRFTEELVGEQ